MDTDGRYSVAFPRRWWYPACRSRDLAKAPHAFTLMETPLVAFRDGAGAPRVLLDRCPHRNYPLSLGRLTGDGTLECGYHGWRFDGCGDCVAVPGHLEGPEATSPTRSVESYPAREQDGFVWVWADPATAPDRDPLALPTFEGKGTGETIFAYDLDCTVHAAVENALDVPHTAFLHAGIFRGGGRNTITAVRRPIADGIEAQYLGEPVAFGPIKPPADSDLTFDHWDRFILPSTAQIEYRVEGWIHIVNTILHLPLSPFETRAWFVVRYWTRLPPSVAKPIVLARGKQILRQDAEALAAQTERIRRFGGERFTSTDLDILGTAIWRMLRQAERAEQAPSGNGASKDGAGDGPAEPVERTVTFEV